MKTYDYKKAKKIIKNNISNLKSASLGMHEDWFWTAETIWENGKYKVKLNNEPSIGGINGSSWATPTIQLVFKDGTDKMIACYSGQSDNQKPFMIGALGAMSKPVQDNITPISEE